VGLLNQLKRLSKGIPKYGNEGFPDSKQRRNPLQIMACSAVPIEERAKKSKRLPGY